MEARFSIMETLQSVKSKRLASMFVFTDVQSSWRIISDSDSEFFDILLPDWT